MGSANNLIQFQHVPVVARVVRGKKETFSRQQQVFLGIHFEAVRSDRKYRNRL